MGRKRVSDADRAPAPSAERPGPASPARDGSAVNRQRASVCPACENISMTERDGAAVCRHCGYTGGRLES